MIVGYELSLLNVANAGAAAPQFELESNATRRAKVRETQLFITGATASRFSIGRPGNTPTGGSVTVGGAQDAGDAAATAGVTSTWTTAPTVPSPHMRGVDFNNVVGSGVIWTWPSDGEFVVGLARSASQLVWSLTAGAAVDGTWIWGE
jgi:hypothetical protein